MINGLSGRPGSGKSYEAVVRHILPALQAGRKVVTNIPLNIDWFCNVIGHECRDLIVQIEGGFHNYGGKRYFSEAEHFLRYADWRNEKNQGVFFVVDECHLCMPKLTKEVSTQQELKEYMSMHRHYGHDILLLSQNFRKVDTDIRDMIQNCYFTIKKSFLGQDDKYILKVAEGVSRNIVAVHERDYEKKFFPAYQSHTKSVGSVQEATTPDVKIWWKNKFIYGGAVCAVLFVMSLMNFFSQRQDHDKKVAEIAEKQKTTAPHVQTTTANQPQIASVQQMQPNQGQRIPPQQKQAPEPVSEEKPEQNKPKLKKHPLDGLYLSVIGASADYTRTGRYQKLVYIAVSRNGQLLKEISSADLALAGYELRIMNDCMIEIHYEQEYQDFLFCDAPTQEVNFANTMPVQEQALPVPATGS